MNLQEKYDELITVTNGLIPGLRAYPEILHKEDNLIFHKYFDKSLYTVLQLLDLTIGLKHLDISQAANNQIEANYFARFIILTSHEVLNDLNKLMGREILEELKNKISEADMKELDSHIKSLNLIRKKLLKKLKELRNSVVGHRNSNALAQTNLMLSIDNHEVYTIGNEIMHELIHFASKLGKLIRNF